MSDDFRKDIIALGILLCLAVGLSLFAGLHYFDPLDQGTSPEPDTDTDSDREHEEPDRTSTPNDTTDNTDSGGENTSVEPAVLSVYVEENIHELDGTDKYDVRTGLCRVGVDVEDYRGDDWILLNQVIDVDWQSEQYNSSQALASNDWIGESKAVSPGTEITVYGEQSGEVYAEGVITVEGEEYIEKLPHTWTTEHPDKITCTLETGDSNE